MAPVVNQTGYAELDPYRLALTQTLVGELSDSQSIRVLPYERLLQIERHFVQNNTDVASREAIRALTTHSAAQFVLVPTLLYENRSWRARVEVRSAETATNVAIYESALVVSSLSKETIYGLMAMLADGIQRHFPTNGPWRTYALNAIRRIAGHMSQPLTPPLRTLDAAKAFEEGTNAYEQLEYASARRAFASAAEQDPRSTLALAWLGHVATLCLPKSPSARSETIHAERTNP